MSPCCGAKSLNKSERWATGLSFTQILSFTSTSTGTHHHDPINHEPHHILVMGDEHVGQAEVLLEVLQEVQHLRLHGLVQRRNRCMSRGLALS